MTTLAPCDAACSATAKPIPDEPPSTTTRLSCKPFPRCIEFSFRALILLTKSKMMPNNMRFMHNGHGRYAFRETTTSRFEPPDYICRDCGGEKHYCGRISAATEPACCEPRVAACPGDVSRVSHWAVIVSRQFISVFM